MTTTRGTTGTKYEATEKLGRVEIAKLIRVDIKEAIKAGEIPAGNYSVRCRSYAGGGSIDVSIADMPAGFRLTNPARVAWEIENPHLAFVDAPSDVLFRHSEQARSVLSKVEAIVAAYNYDYSDTQSDCFNVRFYGSIDFGGEWERATRDREYAESVESAVPSSEPNAQEMFLASMGAI